MKFKQLTLKGMKVDILRNNIVISMEMERTPENIRLCEELSIYKPSKTSSGEMTATFEPNQLPLL